MIKRTTISLTLILLNIPFILAYFAFIFINENTGIFISKAIIKPIPAFLCAIHCALYIFKTEFNPLGDDLYNVERKFTKKVINYSFIIIYIFWGFGDIMMEFKDKYSFAFPIGLGFFLIGHFIGLISIMEFRFGDPKFPDDIENASSPKIISYIILNSWRSILYLAVGLLYLTGIVLSISLYGKKSEIWEVPIVCIYLCILILFAWRSLIRVFCHKKEKLWRKVVLTIGLHIFILSDSVLGLEHFFLYNETDNMKNALKFSVMLTYWIAILLCALFIPPEGEKSYCYERDISSS